MLMFAFILFAMSASSTQGQLNIGYYIHTYESKQKVLDLIDLYHKVNR